MQYLREHRTFKFFWLLLALHFINGSVDPVDFLTNDTGREDLSINEMETIAEIVAEQILDIENCFPEHDEPFEEGNIPVEQAKQLNQYLPTLPAIACKSFNEYSIKKQYFSIRSFNNQFSPEIVPPPPKQVA